VIHPRCVSDTVTEAFVVIGSVSDSTSSSQLCVNTLYTRCYTLLLETPHCLFVICDNYQILISASSDAGISFASVTLYLFVHGLVASCAGIAVENTLLKERYKEGQK
jgi:hypothetical protein